MTDLKTTFAGLQLKNPIIISSSGLTNTAGKNKKLAEAGAGAIVLKSLFEEQILIEADQLKDPTYSEGNDYLADYIREHKLAEYLELIKESKKVCDIPIIASINCYTDTGLILQSRWKKPVQMHWKSTSSLCNRIFNINMVRLNNAILIF